MGRFLKNSTRRIYKSFRRRSEDSLVLFNSPFPPHPYISIFLFKPVNHQLKDIGERKAIEMVSAILEEKDADLTYIGDDCAFLDMGKEYLLVTTDTINERTHIPKGMDVSPRDIGWFASAINLSDIAAMGGRPICLVFALGLPRNYEVEDLKNLVGGMKDCADLFHVPVAGGDTKEHDILTLTGTALGLVDREKILLRKGAEEGDIVAVTGELGKAACAYYSVKHGVESERAAELLFRPVPRVREGMLLSEGGWVTSCMDISDGLAASVHQMAEASGVLFTIDYERIPKYGEAERLSRDTGIPEEDFVLGFGGDYELLVTVRMEMLEKAVESIKKIGTGLTPIGTVGKPDKNGRTRNHLIRGNEILTLSNKGYEHFNWHDDN